jgi:RNA polymerase sigma-70 factor (ECF subfamily)
MDHLEVFNAHRSLLFSLAYDMLGSVMDAEDILQETYLRWQAVEEDVESPKAYLATIVTRLCINQLDSAKARREEYIGPWLPEPLVMEEAENPEQVAALADTLSMALLVVLESLTPLERAVYLLRKVFDYEYREIAAMVGKSEANCRQMVSRAQRRILEERPKVESLPYETQHAITQQFVQAWITGDVDGLMALLSEDVVMQADGGGKVIAARHWLSGMDEVIRVLIGVRKLAPPNTTGRFVTVNGQPGIVIETDGQPLNVVVLDIIGGRIRRIFHVLNPDKLRRVPRSKSK